MLITLSNRIVAIAAGAAIAIGAQFLGPQAGPGTGAGSATSTATPQNTPNTAVQAATVRYWTPARMNTTLQSAKAPTTSMRDLVRRLVPRPVSQLPSRPVGKAASKAPLAPSAWSQRNTAGEGLRWTHDGAVTDAEGKIFFTIDGENYVCSGTLVGGRESDTVLTAAHCVTGGLEAGGEMDWATNWMFVPGYHDGQMPYGEYTAQKFFVTRDWTGPSGNSEQYDVAFVRIAASTPSADETPTPTLPPGLPIAFAGSQDTPPASSAYVFGYPSLAPYSGMYANYCAGPVGASSGSLRTTCEMTAGDSGGPWLAGFSQMSGAGTVVAVTTYKLSNDLSVLYGAVLGPTAHALYTQASGLSVAPPR